MRKIMHILRLIFSKYYRNLYLEFYDKPHLFTVVISKIDNVKNLTDGLRVLAHERKNHMLIVYIKVKHQAHFHDQFKPSYFWSEDELYIDLRKALQSISKVTRCIDKGKN